MFTSKEKTCWKLITNYPTFVTNTLVRSFEHFCLQKCFSFYTCRPPLHEFNNINNTSIQCRMLKMMKRKVNFLLPFFVFFVLLLFNENLSKYSSQQWWHNLILLLLLFRLVTCERRQRWRSEASLPTLLFARHTPKSFGLLTMAVVVTSFVVDGIAFLLFLNQKEK